MSVKTILTSTRGFVRSSAFLATTLALAAALPMSARAATPIAVWDGDFSATQTGYTLNLSGNALSSDNSTITIDQGVGVKVDFATGVNAMTVMFKYSDLSFDAQKTIATSFCSGHDENRTGVYLASGGKANGIWNTDDWGNEMGTLSASSGVLAFCYSKSAGTALYYVSAGSRTQLYNKSNLVASTDAAINGCTLGGERAKTGATLLSAATDMKITGIAVFNGTLSEAEMTAYIWPNDVVEYTLTLDGTTTSWSAGTWKVGETTVDAPTAGYATINLTASTTLTVDEAVGLNELTVNAAPGAVLKLANGENGSFVAYNKVSIESGVLQQGSASVFGATPVVEVAGGATLDLNGFSVDVATAVYIAGAGYGNWPWALTSSGGAFSGTIQNLYLSGNATIGGENQIVLGRDWAGSYGYLGGYTLTKIGAGELLVKNFNTPQTGSIVVSEGTLTTAQWNCLNRSGGDTTLTIADGATVRATNLEANPPATTVLNWDGTLNTASRHFIVKNTLNGGGTTAYLNFDGGATANLKRDLTVTSTLTLSGAMTFLKDAEAESDVVVTASGTISSSSAITVGAGVTLDLGTNRPTGAIAVAEGGTLAVKMVDEWDIICLSATAQPSSVVLYGADGAVITNKRVTFEDGALTITKALPTLQAGASTSFDTPENWIDSTMPSESGDAIIEVSADSAITVADDYTLGDITISGNCVVTFTGEGTISANNIYLKNGATLVRSATISATTGINLDSGTVLRLNGGDEGTVISGAGSVETYGDVVFTTNNTFTGGLTVKSGTTSTTTAAGFGKDNSGSAYSALSRITVEAGACLDLNNTKDHCFALTIAGKGVQLANDSYSGAVKNTGVAMGSGARQTASLTLTADALVDVSSGWGIVQNGHNEAYLALNGHTLTFSGTGTVPMVNVSASNSSGTIVLDGAALELSGPSNKPSNFTGVNIVAKGCATINLTTAPSALGSLTIAPTASGTTASAWNLPSGLVPVVSTANIDFSDLSDGDALTIFTAPSETTLTSETISIVDRTSMRFDMAIDVNKVTATFKAGLPPNFMHYDFDESASAASDSGTSFSVGGEGSSVSLVNSKNGKAIQVHTNFTPWWNALANDTSPFHVGEVTVTAIVKLKQTGIILWGLGPAASNTAMGLVASDANTVSVVAKKGTSTVETLATVTVTSDLTKGWHFFAVVAAKNETTLYVDDVFVSSQNGYSVAIGQEGQLGSFHGGAFGGSKVGADGYYLDDWRVYDTALTDKEIHKLRSALLPPPFVLHLR